MVLYLIPRQYSTTAHYKKSAFKARFAGKDITLNKEKADIINQEASSVKNGRKRQRNNTFSATNRQKVKRARYKACNKPYNISRC
jgi:hypothetical protein